MPVTTSSDYTTEPGETSLTLTYPAGSTGDTLLIWQVIADLQSPTLSGDLDPADLVDTIQSTGKLRVYNRTRQAGDTSATWTVSADVRMIAIAANVPAAMDGADPTTVFVGNSFASVSPESHATGPGLLAVWWSFSDIDIEQAHTVLEAPSPDGDVTVGMELRLFGIEVGSNVVEAAPVGAGLFVRATSHTTIPGGQRWWAGVAGWT